MNFSYCSPADVYATAAEQPKDKAKLLGFVTELEQMGVATLDGVEYIMRPTRWGMEIVSKKDLLSEEEKDN